MHPSVRGYRNCERGLSAQARRDSGQPAAATAEPGSAHEPFVGCEIVTVSAVTACASPVPAAVTHSPTATSPTVALTVSVMIVELEMLTVTFFVFSFGVAFELDGR